MPFARAREGGASADKISGRRSDALRHRTKNRRFVRKCRILIWRIKACLPARQGRGGRARIPSPQTPSHFLPVEFPPRPWDFGFWDLNLGKIFGFFLKICSSFVYEARQDETFINFSIFFTPAKRAIGISNLIFFFQPSQEFKFFIPIPANLSPQEAAVRNPFATGINICPICGGIKKRSFLPFLFTAPP